MFFPRMLQTEKSGAGRRAASLLLGAAAAALAGCAATGSVGPVPASDPVAAPAPAPANPTQSVDQKPAPLIARTNAAENVGMVGGEPVPGGRLPGHVRPLAYTLDLLIDPEADGFAGSAEIGLELDRATGAIFFHSVDHEIDSAQLILADGTVLEPAILRDLAEGGVSALLPASPVGPGRVTAEFTWSAPYAPGLSGLYKTVRDGDAYLATQMEPIDARRLLPSLDDPQWKTPWTVSVTAPASDKVVTNGPLAAVEPAGETEDGRALLRRQFAPTRALQTYLLAFAIGPYEEVNGGLVRADGRAPYRLRAFTAKGKSSGAAEMLRATQPMMDYLSDYFGTPYPYAKLDLIAAPQFAAGAMENAGAIIYREEAFLVGNDTSAAAKRFVYEVHGHELAHQWFGNLVTPLWWDDIWLNEAFATWMSFKVMTELDPEGGWERMAFREAATAMEADTLPGVRTIRNPIRSNEDIEAAFDAITYRKGGGVLEMFDSYLGEAAFRDAMRLHMRRYADGTADTDDFLTSLRDGAGAGAAGIEPAFRSFITQPGIPYLEVEAICGRSADDAARLEVRQSRYLPLGSSLDAGAGRWVVPLVIDAGRAGTVRALMAEEVQSFALERCPDRVMPNAGGSGYLRFALDEAGWQALTSGFAALPPGEQIAFADSAAAAFLRGDLSADAFLDAMSAVARHGSWDAVLQPLDALGSIRRDLDPEARDAFGRMLGQTFGARLRATAEVPEAALSEGEAVLREQLAPFVAAHTVQSDAERRQLLAQGRRLTGAGGLAPDPEAVSPEAREAVFLALAAGSDADRAALLEFAGGSSDIRLQDQALGALVSLGSPEQVAIVLDELTGGTFALNEAFFAVVRAADNENGAEAVWPAMQDVIPALLFPVPEQYRIYMAGALDGFCSREAAEDAAAWLAPRTGRNSGDKRFQAALEQASICEAQRGGPLAALGPAAARWLEAAPRATGGQAR